MDVMVVEGQGGQAGGRAQALYGGQQQVSRHQAVRLPLAAQLLKRNLQHTSHRKQARKSHVCQD